MLKNQIFQKIHFSYIIIFMVIVYILGLYRSVVRTVRRPHSIFLCGVCVFSLCMQWVFFQHFSFIPWSKNIYTIVPWCKCACVALQRTDLLSMVYLCFAKQQNRLQQPCDSDIHQVQKSDRKMEECHVCQICKKKKTNC